MTDFDSIWRTQDEIRTVVRSAFGRLLPTGRKNAVLGALEGHESEGVSEGGG